MAAFLHEEGPEFLKEAPIGFVIELVQLLTNRTVLRFRKGRFIFQKEVANKYEDALPAEEDADKHNAAGVLEDSSGGSDEEGVSDKLPSIPLGDNMALLEAKCRQSSLSLVLGVHFEVTGVSRLPAFCSAFLFVGLTFGQVTSMRRAGRVCARYPKNHGQALKSMSIASAPKSSSRSWTPPTTLHRSRWSDVRCCCRREEQRNLLQRRKVTPCGKPTD